MAISKDWAIAAAVDIIDHVRTGSTLEWVAERIHAHSPFKPDVVYMPVPRCETCALWERHKMAIGATQTGDCRVSVREAFINATRVDFGCVQWKEKS